MPTAGVEITTTIGYRIYQWVFQSFYAHSGRWNLHDIVQKEGIELRFNPFMPTAGVGIRHNFRASTYS